MLQSSEKAPHGACAHMLSSLYVLPLVHWWSIWGSQGILSWARQMETDTVNVSFIIFVLSAFLLESFIWREKKMCSNKLIWGLVLSLFSNFIYKKDVEHTVNYWSPGGEGPEVAVNTKLLGSKKAERILESTSEDSSLLSASKAGRKANGIYSLLRKSLIIPRSCQARALHFWISKSDLTFLFFVGSPVNFYCSCIIIHGVPFNSQRCPNVGHTSYDHFKNK